MAFKINVRSAWRFVFWAVAILLIEVAAFAIWLSLNGLPLWR